MLSMIQISNSLFISSQMLGRIENPDFYLRHQRPRFERVGKSPEALPREHPTGEVTMPHILMERAV